MEWSYSIFVWALGMVIVPAVFFLANVAIRHQRDIPLSSGSDLILLLIAYAACVIADPSVIQGLAAPAIKGVVVPIHLAFLLASGLGWILSTIFVEERLGAYYRALPTAHAKEVSFPYFSWFLVWSMSFAIVVVYMFVIRE